MKINLLPWREALSQKRKKRLWIESMSIFVLLVLCSIIWQVSQHHALAAQKQQRSLLEQKIVAISAYYMDALNKQKLQVVERKQEVLLKNQEHTNQALFSVLDKLVEKMPKEIYLISIKKKENKLYLVGKSPSHVELATFLQHIETQTHRQPIVTETTHAEDQSVEIDFEIGYEIS